ncbi:MAG: SpaA isopeptide-forming pilin-related protein [Hornefia sp.]|nr:SpaA isopeptide-forming pilin-related protein [Hornefia sp.]
MKENQKKKISSLLVCFLVFAMMITGMHSQSFAANGGKVTIKNVEAGATVTAYQIVKKDAAGKWVAVKGGKPANPQAPKSSEIIELAKDTSGLTSTPIDEKSGNDYTKTLEPGMYLVLVSKTNNAKVYNPMIVSVNYDYSAATPGKQGGTVDANSKFAVGAETAYAKSTEPTLDKKIAKKVQNGSVTNDSTVYGDSLKPGDITNFDIITTIPSYSKQYENPQFIITDEVSEGLDAPTNIEVFGPENVKLTNGTEYRLAQTGKKFTITFTKDYLLSGNSAKSIVVKYMAKLNDKATSGFDANTNKAYIDYSNNPNENKGHKEKKTYHYTFDIDGNIGGKIREQSKEIVKVGVDKLTGDVIKAEKITNLSTVQNKLKGAEFKLYKANAAGTDIDGPVLKTVTTDANGLMKFAQLDAGKYILQESKAPDGYVLNDKKIPVSITAELNGDGTLKSYSVTIDGKATSTYTSTYENGEIKTTVEDNSNKSGLFQNVRPGGLPSTGGIGTYIFYALGMALMALAAFMYVGSRKNKTYK